MNNGIGKRQDWAMTEFLFVKHWYICNHLQNLKSISGSPESGGCLFLSIFLMSSNVTVSSENSPPCITCQQQQPANNN